MTPLKAIRAKCVDCCCGQLKEVNLCPSEDCPLWLYRFGHNPNRKGIGGGIGNQKNNNSATDTINKNETEGIYIND